MKVRVLILFLLPIKLFSITDAVDNTSLYNKALGGPHTCLVRGVDTFFNNPALLAEYDSSLTVFRFISNFKGDAFDMLNLYLGDKLQLDENILTSLETEGVDSIYLGIDLVGPISVGYIGNNWGFLINNSSSVYFDLPRRAGEADILAREDFTISAGIAFPFTVFENKELKMAFTPGAMFRSTLRGEVNIEKDLLGLVGYMDDFTTILDDYPFYLSPLFALDAGFSFKINEFFMLSGVVKDIYTPILKYPVSDLEGAIEIFTTVTEAEGNLTYREINFGMGFDIPLGPAEMVISDLDVYIDYYDLLMLEENPFLHIGTGMDLVLLQKLHLLAGFYEGLLSLGLNIDLKGFNIGFAMYGSEEGSQPGNNSVFNFLLSLGVSF